MKATMSKCSLCEYIIATKSKCSQSEHLISDVRGELVSISWRGNKEIWWCIFKKLEDRIFICSGGDSAITDSLEKE